MGEKSPFFLGKNSMECEDPILCYDSGEKKIYRHYSLASPVIRQVHQKRFNCGQCLICRKKKAQELAMRSVLHASLYKDNCFITLTYDEKKEGYHNGFCYTDIQKFKKRLRSHVHRKNGARTQIFNVHEYGAMGKKHWHLLIFNFNFGDRRIFTVSNNVPLYTSQLLSKLWPYGFNTIGDVSIGSAMYLAQYTQKDTKYGHANGPRRSHSKHSGIGRDYFLQHYEQILSLGYVPFNGQKVPIPRYFQRLAHKHYSHFYATENFFDLPTRLRLYAPFKQGEANLAIANLFSQFQEKQQIKLVELNEEWHASIKDKLYGGKTDFQKSAENLHHDLKNKQNSNHF